ncbi:MAG: hypothetical protein DI539_13835, partial [Flavobacterium psychrophilum]
MYQTFKKYLLRTPIFPIDYFFQLTREFQISDAHLKEQFKNPLISEAIYLASPVLFKEILKWSNGETENGKEQRKIKNSFLKYLSRLSSRSTPFGLFAGNSVGTFEYENAILRDEGYQRHTRLDMNLTGALVKVLQSDPTVREELCFYPNSSLYNAGNQIRYVESKYNKTKIKHQIVEVENSHYLKGVIEQAQHGVRVRDLVSNLVSQDIFPDDATAFINDLIDSQILVSEMEQTVSGAESLDQIMKVISEIENNLDLSGKLLSIQEMLNQLDNGMVGDLDNYDKITKIIKTLDVDFDEKYLFQTDISVSTSSNTLDSVIESELLECIGFLNKISRRRGDSELLEFTKVFTERYEGREMPLAIVLDEEMGIGYPVRSRNGDINPLIDDLIIKGPAAAGNSEITAWQSLLLRKTIESQKNGFSTIVLTDDDVAGMTASWDDLPDTFSTIAQVINLEEEIKIVMSGVGGSSAANIMGRFCHGDNEIHSLVKEIIYKEEAFNDGKILAEIVHLPEDRLGNILIRPSFRKFEIPYLAPSSKAKENTLLIDDIMVSVFNNRIVLKNRVDGKEILPRLTTAHNYARSLLPIYRFLCDMQHYRRRPAVFFDWGPIANYTSHLPRVLYKSTILSAARWTINERDLQPVKRAKTEDEIYNEIRKLVKERTIP